MEAMKDFCLWFLQTMPDILLEPPISAFTGLALLGLTIRLIWQMCHIT